jgi:hypothetical protein
LVCAEKEIDRNNKKETESLFNGTYKVPTYNEKAFGSMIKRLERENPSAAIRVDEQVNTIKQIFNDLNKTFQNFNLGGSKDGFENILDRELPFIIIKEINNNYELLVLNDKYLFEFNHPIINELINDVYVVGFDKNKKLELSKDKLNIKQDLIDIKPKIKLRLVPMRILNFLKNYNIYRNKNILFNKKYKLNLININ